MKCYCQADRGVLCIYHLSASRIRIMAREFDMRGDSDLAMELFDQATEIEQKATADDE